MDPTEILDEAFGDVPWPMSKFQQLHRCINISAEQEREECARLFDSTVWSWDYTEIASVIRARGVSPRVRTRIARAKVGLPGGEEALERSKGAKREWVGLTDEEALGMLGQMGLGASVEDIRFVEAKLKEKNT